MSNEEDLFMLNYKQTNIIHKYRKIKYSIKREIEYLILQILSLDLNDFHIVSIILCLNRDICQRLSFSSALLSTTAKQAQIANMY